MRDLDKYQTDYINLPFEPHHVRYRKRKVVECLRKHRARRILEVGCGVDPLFMSFADFETLDVVEPSAAFFEIAEQSTAGMRNVRLHRGTLEENAQQLSGHSFDFILLSSLLHELQDPRGLLCSVRALCDATTLVHIVVPNAKSLHRLLALEMGLIDSIYRLSSTQHRMQQHTSFDLCSLSELVTSCGFSVVESGTFFIKPFTHAQMAELLKCGFLTEQMLDGLYGLSAHLPEFGSELFINAKADPGRMKTCSA